MAFTWPALIAASASRVVANGEGRKYLDLWKAAVKLAVSAPGCSTTSATGIDSESRDTP
ncbi:hypothetical protein GALL_396750 [mine drainage metagenome]|uniref:Uncharacterized protein n=1 Tax=mine drainage metagenome TaxID=410659 RepID=A0A1J5QF63_9ZZZZ